MKKVTNENFTFSLKKIFHMRYTMFAELNTQCSSDQEGSTILQVLGNKV